MVGEWGDGSQSFIIWALWAFSLPSRLVVFERCSSDWRGRDF